MIEPEQKFENQILISLLNLENSNSSSTDLASKYEDHSWKMMITFHEKFDLTSFLFKQSFYTNVLEYMGNFLDRLVERS